MIAANTDTWPEMSSVEPVALSYVGSGLTLHRGCGVKGSSDIVSVQTAGEKGGGYEWETKVKL